MFWKIQGLWTFVLFLSTERRGDPPQRREVLGRLGWQPVCGVPRGRGEWGVPVHCHQRCWLCHQEGAADCLWWVSPLQCPCHPFTALGAAHTQATWDGNSSLVSAFGSPNQAVLYMADLKRPVLQPL